MKIKICKKSPKLNKLQKKLTIAFPTDTIVIKKCINACKDCKEQFIVRFKHQQYKAASISKLIKKVEK